jgi:predicted Zn finger-like uncharacterized protein
MPAGASRNLLATGESTVEYRIACPQCHWHLKSARPVPAGMKVKCSHCGTLFNAAPDHALAAAPMPAAAPLAAPQAPAVRATPPAPAPARAPRADRPREVPAPEARPARSAAVLALVAGGAGLLLALAVVLVLFCFSGEERTPPPAPDGGDAPPGVRPVAKKKKPAPPLIELSPEEQKQVDAAVQKGVAFLKARQQSDGRWDAHGRRLGATALAALTLLEAGVPPGDPALVKAADAVRASARGLHETYDLSLAILFLNRLGDAKDREVIQRLALRLVAGQHANGGWDYHCPVLPEPDHQLLLGLLQELDRRRGADPADLREHVAKLRGGDPRRLPLRGGLLADPSQPDRFFRGGAPDNSNTQFAILALWAARSHGLPLDRTLALINRRFRATQLPDGRWGYRDQGEVSQHVPGKGQLPTMTCAGLLGVAVGFGLQEAGKPALRPEQDAVVQKGLKHLSKFIGQPGEHGGRPPMQQLYFLWSAERVAVLYQLKTIEGKKWYHWGMETLLAHQRPDGSWQGGGHGSEPVIDTSFAILFLHRVNLAKDLTDKLMELAAAPPAVGPPPARKD